jgi:hypothetical protein
MTEHCGQEVRQATAMPGIDIDRDAHAWPQRRQALVICVDPHTHRDALDNFYPITASVLCRQK